MFTATEMLIDVRVIQSNFQIFETGVTHLIGFTQIKLLPFGPSFDNFTVVLLTMDVETIAQIEHRRCDNVLKTETG
jgi:hypothetical protein